jgi:hypothetical protein
MSPREKIDGVLVLSVYFLPILVMLSWFLGAVIFFLYPADWFDSVWSVLPIFAFSGVGNFALFFEIGVGLYLDNRSRASWLMPTLFLSFLFNVVVCFKAFFDIVSAKVFGRDKYEWIKTFHNGGVIEYS